MKRRALIVAGVLAILAAALLPGCGGEHGALLPIYVGIYNGTAAGDGAGPMVIIIRDDGTIVGTIDISPICASMTITGTYNPDGTVTFTATGCGITVNGTGTLTQTAPGSTQFTGSGTWTGPGGQSGTWAVTRTGGTGTI